MMERLDDIYLSVGWYVMSLVAFLTLITAISGVLPFALIALAIYFVFAVLGAFICINKLYFLTDEMKEWFDDIL